MKNKFTQINAASLGIGSWYRFRALVKVISCSTYWSKALVRKIAYSNIQRSKVLSKTRLSEKALFVMPLFDSSYNKVTLTRLQCMVPIICS